MSFIQFWSTTIYTMRGGLIPLFLLFTLWFIYDVIDSKWKDRPSNIKQIKTLKH